MKSITDNDLIYNLLFIALTSFAVVALGDSQALVYTILFGLTILIISGADKYKYRSAPYFASIMLCIMLLSTTMGLRDFGVGYDTNLYIEYYFNEAKWVHSISNLLTSDGDIGFTFLAFIANLFSGDAQSLLIVTELWICLFTFAAIHEVNKESRRIEWSTFILLWLFTFLNASLNLMRQYCAMSMLLLAFAYLLNNKWKKAIAIQVLSYFFHSSAIVFAPVFGLFYLSTWENKKKRNVYTAMLLIAALFSAFNFFLILPFLSNAGIVSELYADRYGSDSEFSSANLFGVAIIVLYILGYIAIYFAKKHQILKENEAYIAFGIHTLFFILRLLAFYVVYLSRLSAYYYYIDILLIALILNTKKIPVWLKLGIYVCTIYLWYRSYIAIPGGDTYPFKSAILGL